VTYSVVARHPETGEMGVACQSHFFGVGSVVNWGQAGAGVVATQSFVNLAYGAQGVARMARGEAAPAVLDALVREDPRPDLRQVAMLDHAGNLAVHTGSGCVAIHGSRAGDGFSVQGNMLADHRVIEEAAVATANGLAEGLDLPAVLIGALAAAERAGGDARGSQAAAMLVVGGHATDRPWEHVRLDLRVEDARDPVGELTRLVSQKRVVDQVVAVMFAEGLMVGPYREPEPGAADRALEQLTDAAHRWGPGNLEPAMWQVILLIRAGRIPEALSALRRIEEIRPDLRTFIRRLCEAGFATWPDAEEIR
jgi:uncharacterized Ntn-hydrolase superfamily protein